MVLAGERYVDHEVLKTFAQNKVNVPKEEAAERRRQVNHLRERLETHIAAHPDYNLVKLRASGSTAKHTAIRRRGGGSDADVAAYVRAAVDIDETTLLDWLRDRCIEVYGETKVAEDFVISRHAVGITLRGTGLKIDVAPVLYNGEPDDQGYLVTRQGDRVLTSVTLHLQFIRERRKKAGPGYPELIRLLKAWIRTSKDRDPDLRCKSFLLELLVAHLWETGWNGEPLQVNDYPRAIEQVLAYIARTGLKSPIVFTDYYKADEVAQSWEPIQVWDPVSPENNVASSYTQEHRQRLVELATTALDSVAWAAVSPTKGDAYDAWRELYGPTFPGA
ncbi:nucleotidyltransferase [Yinghuangia sp. ASG 101]|uniref:CBASS oligonucleotide cyclase n=1 Tax=Yinghuangia sp. ASG 101 TaxID=2896848 RepID=UPI001E362911|nr:CBASS oligonucleotide cyclase [Yinghuangia sp. ASG 101]UGQ13557.1 nucleotidyltransferase [Yinghuangia sp. ASG 101]